MAKNRRVHSATAVFPEVADESLLASGSIAFALGDNLTTEKKSSAISLLQKDWHPDGVFLLTVERPDDATAGTMTVKVYVQDKIDGTNSRDCLLAVRSVDNTAGAVNAACFEISGLGIGLGTVVIGALFAADSGAVTVNFRLHRPT